MEGPPRSHAASLSRLSPGTPCSTLSSGNPRGNFSFLGFARTGPSFWECLHQTLHPLSVSPVVLFCRKASSPLLFLSALSACRHAIPCIRIAPLPVGILQTVGPMKAGHRFSLLWMPSVQPTPGWPPSVHAQCLPGGGKDAGTSTGAPCT